MTITTTLNAIRAHGPCEDEWDGLLISQVYVYEPDNDEAQPTGLLNADGIMLYRRSEPRPIGFALAPPEDRKEI